MNNQAAQTMPFQPEIFRAIARSTSDTAKTNALLNAAREIERLTAALSQTAGVAVSDEMVERACKDYALRVDGALWPDAYDEHEVLALRAQMREFLLNAIGAAPAASGGEDDEAPEPTALQIRYAEGYSDGVRDTERIAKERESSAASASGGEADALPDGTLSKSTVKRVTALAAASVSERARELLQAELVKDAYPRRLDSGGFLPPESCLRAIERALGQALTQQRGSDSDLPFATTQRVVRALLHLGHGVPEGHEEQYARSNELVLTLCSEVMASTTPQPGAERQPNVVRIPQEKRWVEGDSELLKWHADGYNSALSDVMSVNQGVSRLEPAEQPGAEALREAVAYIESYECDGITKQGLVWADHPANTPGHLFTPLYTTTPNSGDARLRQLADEWRELSASMALTSYTGATLDKCADELESLLGRGAE